MNQRISSESSLRTFRALRTPTCEHRHDTILRTRKYTRLS